MKLKKIGLAMVFAGLFAAGNANAYLQNWALDSNGAAAGGVIAVQELVDLTGTSYIKNTFAGPVAPGTGFTFKEAGLFDALTVDGGPSSGGANLIPGLSASFTGTGSGTVGTGFTFNTDGVLKIFDAATNPVATFQLVAGSGDLQNSSLVPNGTVSLVFQATAITAGYFFRDITLTDDLFDNIADGLFFGFVSVNASTRANGFSTTPINNLFNTTYGPDTANPNNQVSDLWIGNNGQFRISVPEPGSLALLGLGLAGLGALRRRGR